MAGYCPDFSFKRTTFVATCMAVNITTTCQNIPKNVYENASRIVLIVMSKTFGLVVTNITEKCPDILFKITSDITHTNLEKSHLHESPSMFQFHVVTTLFLCVGWV